MIKPARYYFFILFTVFPHLLILPLDITSVLVLLFVWAGIFSYRHQLRPSVWVLRGLTIGSLCYSVLRFGTLADPTAATSFLCMITVLKIFETQSYRDAMALLIISLLVVMAYLVESYSLLASTYMVIVFVFSIYFMMELQRKRYFLKQSGLRWKDLFSLEMVVALPLLVGLFVFFPRFTTRLGTGERQVHTVGFSEQIHLGEMIKLAQSNEIAFKVRFLKRQPTSTSDLYFRGAVLTQPKNMSWTKSTATGSFYQPAGDIVEPEYQILLPPREQRNLFTLADAVLLKTNPRLLLLEKKSENVFYTNGTIEQNISYTAYTEKTPNLSYTPEELKVPDNISIHIRNLASTLQGPTPEESIKNILQYFKNNKFEYSTEVPGYKNIGEFLQQKVGFCEHYASAFALLARELDIPSRVLAGFVGGETNPYDSTITVRDKFAHAWVEIFFAEKGWTRIDPTAVVYPQRMENLLATTTMGQQFYGGIFSRSLLFMESINTQFEMFLIGYNNDSQWNFLARLSSYLQWNILVLLFTIPLFLILCLAFLWWIWRFEWIERDSLAEGYLLIQKKLSRFGISKPVHQGPMDFRNVVERKNEVPRQYGELIQRYMLLRYSQAGHKELAQQFYKSVRQLR